MLRMPKHSAFTYHNAPVAAPSTSIIKYLIVSLVYSSDSTCQKSSMYPSTPPVFAMHSRKNILREPMRYLMTDVLFALAKRQKLKVLLGCAPR